MGDGDDKGVLKIEYPWLTSVKTILYCEKRCA